jgi:hypothetical protein
MGLLWLQRELRASGKVIDGYVQRVFTHLWKDDGAIESARDIESLLLAAADDLKANFGTARSSGSILSKKAGREAELSNLWLDYARSQGREDVDGAHRAAQSEAISMAPTFSLGSEPFQGRAHFPLMTARLKAGI